MEEIEDNGRDVSLLDFEGVRITIARLKKTKRRIRQIACRQIACRAIMAANKLIAPASIQIMDDRNLYTYVHMCILPNRQKLRTTGQFLYNKVLLSVKY